MSLLRRGGELNTQQVACPYCGAVIRSDFYDWQTEDFEIYEKPGANLQRARHPERRKTDGDFFTEKECPSCGANFIPDENHCCSYCGYGLQVNNAKWVLVSPKQ